MHSLFGFDRSEYIAKDLCIPKPYGCGKPIGKFKDKVSETEYQISGLCQECQDKVFSPENET